ncbi:MAG TPA: bifunctional lysylphosphatidylglycerol flippase/synthetase MprF [Candidatus Binataceae bacterium]|nr:bifunctional lysylphosphatidylglycerol flippase/synthetase MprF [Candidatus Binataceae bacterium]
MFPNSSDPTSLDSSPAIRELRFLRRLVRPIISISAFGVLLIAIPGLSRDLAYHAIVRALREMPPGLIWISVLLTCVSYLALAAREQCALNIVGIKISTPAVMLASLCGSALGNAVGFGSLTANTVRDRVYGTVGVRPEATAQVALFSDIAFGIALGVFWLTSLVLARKAMPLRPITLTGICLITVAIILAALYVARSWIWKSDRIGAGAGSNQTRKIERAMLQLGVSVIDLAAAAGAFWCLLPGKAIDLPAFAAIYSTATALGVVSGIPGGLGIFDVVLFVLLRDVVPSNQLAAALLIYRGVYFVMPLLAASAGLAGFELRSVGGSFDSRAHQRLSTAAGLLAPIFLSVTTFAVGAMLIVSGATPAVDWRLAALQRVLPLWAVETSHLLATLAGVFLLFVARGLYHRLDGAWWLALLLALVNVAFSLTKGLAFGETAAMLLLVCLLLATRREFTRPAALIHQPFRLGWFVAIAVVLVGAAGILLFAFRDVPYQREIWWQFEFDAQASRSLRAILGSSILVLGISLWQLLRAAPGRIAPPSRSDLSRAEEIIRRQERSAPMLALMGDKSFLFSSSGRSLLMYAKRGRSWVALFDPVGPREERLELVWRFVELADEHDGRAAFYQVRPDNLPIYLDAALRVVKIGEEACLDLESFSLEGSVRYGLRQAVKRAEREGLTLQIHSRHDAADLKDVLGEISRSWLAVHRGVERRFSVAAFEPRFMAAQPVAIAYRNGVPLAFVTYMTTDCRDEATIGLMRQVPDAPSYTMEFMFSRLALELKAQHYRILSLGMAPLAGITRTPVPSGWNWVAGQLWEHGRPIYNFRGLRSFKSKFKPNWEPRYLAASGAIGPFLSLADVAALASGFGRTSSAA